MNHPPREEWVAYLYGECDSRAQGRLTAHMRECDECREHVETWRKTMYAMSAWELPPATRRQRKIIPQWAPVAAAAALALFVGVVATRLTAPAPVDVAALRMELDQNLRREITAEWRTALALTSERMYSDLYTQLRSDVDSATARAVLLTKAQTGRALGSFAEAYDEDQTLTREAVARYVQDVDERRARDVHDLRTTVRSLASLTGYEIERTQDRIGALGSYMRAVPVSVPLNDPERKMEE